MYGLVQEKQIYLLSDTISMGKCKKDVTPLLMHWSYIFFALTHWYKVQIYFLSDTISMG